MTRGPPAFRARCTCGEWRIDWTATDILQHGLTDLPEVEAAVRQNHDAHARGRTDLRARNRRSESFY